MAGLIAVTGLLLSLVLALTAVVAARHRAGAAADLAALAAAGVVPGPSACPLAGEVAAANGARLVRCRVLADGSVRIGVSVVLSAGGWHGSVSGEARAGRLLRFHPSL